MIHSYNQFHAAGHGTFFSGQLIAGEDDKPFLWVYDCGSSQDSSRMRYLVSDLHTHAGVDVIDMLCISHFDDDHVNGLVALLSVFSVERLFLPYLPFKTRLEIACAFGSAPNADVALFALDPRAFLAARGLGEKVRSIVLVEGGDAGVENAPGNIDGLPLNPEEPEDGDYATVVNGGVPGVTRMSHSRPLVWGPGHWEFVFYNRDLPVRQVHPPLTLADVQAKVRAVLVGLCAGTGGLPWAHGNWVGSLRRCYLRLFGAAPASQNNISLCLLSRPLITGQYAQCAHFKPPSSMMSCAHTHIPVSGSRAVLLLTGDMTITHKELAKMRRHFTPRRWDEVYLMQVPHHGSKWSWKALRSTLCVHDYSVFCVPDSDPYGHHPHAGVVGDMAGRHPVYANDSASVIYCFHLEAAPEPDETSSTRITKFFLEPPKPGDFVF